MSVDKSTPIRRRRTSQDARAEALAAARRLLLESGPGALTLKAVATEVGVTHANLLHHFGSAGGLQADLMTMMIRDLTDTLRGAVAKFRAGEASLDELVGLVFDAFGAGGAGHLAAWMVLNRETDRLQPIAEAVQDFADAIALPDRSIPVEKSILFVTLMAFANGVIGKHLAPMLGQTPDAARQIAVQLTPQTMG